MAGCWGYSASTLQQVKVWNDTANGDKGGIWQSGAAPSVDADGNIYLTIGNGASDAGTGGHNYGDSIVRIPTTGGQPFAPADFFTPHNHSDLENLDLDLGSTGVLLVPPRASGATPEAFFGGKEGNLYLVNRNNLGGFDSVNDNVIQIIGGQGRHGTFDSPAYYNNRVFFAASNGPLETLIIINGTASAGQQTAEHYGFPGVNPSISANGAGNGIVWVIAKGSDGHAILEAFSATNLSKKLYSSDTAGARDLPGDYVKFTTPTIADGKVIIGTGNELDVYGLL
ncbi:MAG TPA: hypothetical protein VHD56_19540 [Tepidisphaeraceae bacterium]|nr:hypothetical protein [Tepidisphaeraceae bacterium]